MCSRVAAGTVAEPVRVPKTVGWFIHVTLISPQVCVTRLTLWVRVEFGEFFSKRRNSAFVTLPEIDGIVN